MPFDQSAKQGAIARKRIPSLCEKVEKLAKEAKIFAAFVYFSRTDGRNHTVAFCPDGQHLPDMDKTIREALTRSAMTMGCREELVSERPTATLASHDKTIEEAETVGNQS